MATIDDAFAVLWRAARSTIPLNPDAAIYKFWRSRHASLGSPITPETDLDTGGTYQVFTHSIITWDPTTGVQEVLE